ncbi:hypothetical protein B7755_009055 [Streptomyces sp. NBS 14/10]|uniref:hypothetical protein n=1 Tax=Streptomyces sp. NBS 14/10 TaxID=1945643 RepID=UPI000B7CA713|nr:hypothetical protein [Streptomyces sp. NBS 14/10]KAK1178268.1 hypothetical protein B7755_009055 [Streptomyces sp. NBS 14/10]NUP45272.1 hypothetical protein [Streptomyces sp.]NUS81662.1 hypothetical protein [Streptomyces sp.]
MRTSRCVAAAVLVAAVVGFIAVASNASNSAAQERPRPREAACSTWVRGSHATASCFNPNPDVDRVQLHVECARWWDPDMDGRSVEVGPAQHVRLADRCWKEIRKAWVSHH